MITLDFETYYDKEYSLSKITMEQYIRDPRFQVIGVCVKRDEEPIEWITGSHEHIKAELEKRHLENEAVIAHNAAFDCAILNWIFDIRPKIIVDTMSMLRPIIGIFPQGVSLRAAAEFFGIGHKGTEVYKTIGKRLEDFSPKELADFADYCRGDVQLTWDLWKLLSPAFPKRELYLIDLVIRMFTEPVFEIDVPLLEKHLAEVRAKKQALLESVGHGSREVFMSNDKFAQALRDLGVDPPTKISPKTGKEAYAFAKTDLGMQALLDHPDERVQALATARLGLKSTIEETRTETFINIGKRGAFPILLRYCGAVNTQRFSGGEGTNPQNLPRGGVLRHAMRAPDGYCVVACDSSNVEARTLAWEAGEKQLLELFARGEDVYSSFASKVYNRPINKHDNPVERFTGKTCILGLGYGTGWKKLQQTLHNGQKRVDLPDEECQRIVKLYRDTYTSIPKFWRRCQEVIGMMYEGWTGEIQAGSSSVVYEGGHPFTITMPNGLSMKYPELQSEPGEFGPEYTYQKGRFRNKIYGGALTENLTQCLARIIVAYQMCKIKQELDKRSAEMKDGKIRRVVHMVHDEVVCVVPEDEFEWTAKMMETIMCQPPSWAKDLPLACESGGGKTYGDAK